MVDRLKSWLSSDRTPVRLAVVGLILGAPALGIGLFGDDYVYKGAITGVADSARGITVSPFRLFSFMELCLGRLHTAASPARRQATSRFQELRPAQSRLYAPSDRPSH